MLGRYTWLKDALLLLGGWLAVVLLVNPAGEFPLNDDWCYAKSVETLVQEGRLHLYNWGEMTLVAHVWWGALFAKVVGFSFAALRASTLVMGFLAVLGTYTLTRTANLARGWALLAAALLLVNPLFVALSHSFMTDVPFTAVIVWASVLYLRAAKNGSYLCLSLAIVLTAWAFLIRQLALVLPLAWLAAMLLTKPRNRRTMLHALLPALVLALVYVGYSYGMEAAGLLQERYNNKLSVLGGVLGNLTPEKLVNIPGYVVVSASYLGLFLLPIALAAIPKTVWQRKKWWFGGIGIALLAVLFFTGKLIPALDNVLIDAGIGPTTTYDHYNNFKQTPAPQAPMALWLLVTAAGVAGGLGLLWQPLSAGGSLIRLRSKRPLQTPFVFAFAFLFIYLAPFMVVGIYDRYLVTIMPLAVLLCVQQLGAFPRPKAWPVHAWARGFFVALLATFSVCATHDYMSWNRTRWDALNNLMDSGIASHRIAGGVEFDAWYHFSDSNPEWYKTATPEYQLVFTPLPNQQVIDTLHYSRWMPGTGTMYLTKSPEQ